MKKLAIASAVLSALVMTGTAAHAYQAEVGGSYTYNDPDDFDAINVAENSIAANAKAAFEQDSSITPGGCVLENALSSVDATLETRWSRAIANLGLSSTWDADDATH